jgi:hypothetical protein
MEETPNITETEIYTQHIQKILSNGTDNTFEKNLMLFLSEKHSDGEEPLFVTRSLREKKIKLNRMTGTIFSIKKSGCNVYVTAVYIGESKLENDLEISYFYIFGDRGLSFWDHIYYETLKNEKILDIHLLRCVKMDKVTFNKTSYPSSYYSKELFKNLEMFCDGKIICPDGPIMVSRMLLSMRSSYFFAYFSKYAIENTIQMEHPKILLETYIRFLILNEISYDILSEHHCALFDFGNIIGDIAFIEFIYHQLWDNVDDFEKKVLNDMMGMYNVVNKVL